MAEPTEPNAEAAVETDEGGQKKGGKLFLIMMLPLVLLPMVGGGYLAYSQYPQIVAAAQAFTGGDETEDDGKDTIEYGQFVEIENLVINPADADSRYLMVNLGIEVADEAGVAEIDARKIVIRDQILRDLSKRRVSELADVDHREEIIKTDLINLINGVLSESEVQRLHFTAYVLQ